MRTHNVLNDVDYDASYTDTAIKNMATYVTEML